MRDRYKSYLFVNLHNAAFYRLDISPPVIYHAYMSDTKYYLAKPGTKDVQGPVTVDEIRAALHAGSMTYDYVYCAVGMKEWKPVVSLPGLVPEMPAAAPGAPSVPPVPPTGGAGVPVPSSVPMAKPDNYLVMSIIMTIFCCLPLGVVAIVKASQVDSLWAQGLQAQARVASDSAKTWCWASFWCGLVPVLLYALAGVIASLSEV